MFLSENCSICCGTYKKPVSIICKHVFCFSCLHKWYSASSFYTHNNIKVAPCPICRKYFYEKDIKSYKIKYSLVTDKSRSKNSKTPTIPYVRSRTRNQTHQERWTKSMKYLHDICFAFNNNSTFDNPKEENIINFLKHLNENNWFLQKNGWGSSSNDENNRKAFIKLLTDKLHHWRESGVIYSNYFIFKYRDYLYKNN